MGVILVVDDEEGLRTVISNILKAEGYNVVTSEDGHKAISIFRQENVDAVFLDIRLPDMDGVQILEEMKKFNPQVPVIMCSGFADIETAVNTVRMGAFDYINKPFKRDEVLRAAAKAVRARNSGSVNVPLQGQTVRDASVNEPTVATKPIEKKTSNIIPAIVSLGAVIAIVGGMFFLSRNIISPKDIEFSTPYSNPTALTYDGKNLWASDWVTQSIYKHNIRNLAVESVYPMTGSHPTGLAFDGVYLWSCDSWARAIYKRSLDGTLSIIVSYPSPGKEPSGLFWDGMYLWCFDSKEQKIYKLRVKAEGLMIEKEFPSPCRVPVGMFSDKNSFWIADSETNKIFQVDKNSFSVIEIYSLSQYQSGGKLAGMTFDGTYIWTCSEGNQKIYRHSKKSLKSIK